MNPWLAEAERRGDEAADFADWVNDNEVSLVERYAETLDIDDVPDDFLESEYQSYLECE